MKYCVKCGQQMSDETIFCPACGCAAGDPNPYANGNAYAPGNPYGPGVPFPGNDSFAIREYSRHASTIRTLGIFAAVLMFGIGFIFSIIIWIKAITTKEPMVMAPSPYDLAELESARKKIKLGKALSVLPLIAFVLSFLFGIVLGLLGGM